MQRGKKFLFNFMLIPTKYEKLNQNAVVIGASVLGLLRKKKYSVEELYQILKKEKQINLERFFNVLSFLWVADAIETDDFYVSIKKSHVS